MHTLPPSYLFCLCCHQSQVSWLAASLYQRLACFFELAFSSNTLISAICPFLLLHLSSTAPIPGIAGLDSFVYTLGSLQQAKSHLSEDGIVALTFGAKTSWIDERLGQLLTEVFGEGKVYVYFGEIGTTFVASNSEIDTSNTALTLWQADPDITELPLTTDDWPYLYLRSRNIPDAYWQAILLIVVLSMFMISRSFPQALKPEWHFLLLGAAFLLIEFKSITELALIFGTTWIVNALAISGVLLMALAANIIVLWRAKINLNLSYILLFSSLAISYFFPLDILIGTNPIIRVLASTLLLSLPIFFAGLIFSESLRQAGETGRPLASNLSGSVAGGVLEYGSILWGIKSLYVVAAIVYLGAWISSRLKK